MSLQNILNKTALAALVEELVVKEKMGYIEAMIHICEERGIDPADIAKLVSPPIKAKLEAEGMSSNLLPRGNSLF
jgi:hypothetical protein